MQENVKLRLFLNQIYKCFQFIYIVYIYYVTYKLIQINTKINSWMKTLRTQVLC